MKPEQEAKLKAEGFIKKQFGWMKKTKQGTIVYYD